MFALRKRFHMGGTVNKGMCAYVMRSGKKICYFLTRLLFESVGLKEVQILFLGRKFSFV